MPTRILHSVFFQLKHEKDSAAEQDFLATGKALSEIATVENFKVLREISPKNEYDWGFSMEFVDQDAYTTYNEHPDHVAFVAHRWQQEVTTFMEIDYLLG